MSTDMEAPTFGLIKRILTNEMPPAVRATDAWCRAEAKRNEPTDYGHMVTLSDPTSGTLFEVMVDEIGNPIAWRDERDLDAC